MEKQAAYLTLIGDTEGAKEDSLLEYVYRITRPQLASESERKAHVSAISMLENLHSQIEETMKELSKFNSSIVPEDGGPPITLSRLLPSLDEAEFQIRSMLTLLAGAIPVPQMR